MRFAIRGRDAELAAIEDLLHRARAGHGAALLIRGHPGLGKSMLLGETGRTATTAGMTVLTANGVAAESALPFAGLHQLLAPLLGRPDAGGLLASMVRPDGARPDRFAAGLAVLGLLREAAAGTPLALLVDDAHRLDPDSLDVLVFVARRLTAEPIALILTAGVRHDQVLAGTGLSELHLAELDRDAARAVLDDRVPAMAPDRRDRTLAAAAGHPLALVELPGCLPAVDSAEVPLSERLREAFADRYAHLPEPTRAVLAALAADVDSPPDVVVAAASALTGAAVDLDSVQPAIDAGLLEIRSHRLRFRQPLVRHAVYHGLPVAERLRLHAVLADLVADDPDRRARHRAAATLGPDERAGQELEAAAARALDRGTPVPAVTHLERAADLTLDAARHTSLLLRAAEVASQLHDRSEAARLAARAEPVRGTTADRARQALVGDVVDPGDLRDEARIDALCELAMDAHEAGETDLAAALCWQAVSRCWRAGLPAEVGARILAVHGKLGFAGDDPRSVVVAAYAQPDVLGGELLRRLPALVPDRSDIDGMHLLAAAAMVLGDLRTGVSFLGTAVAGYRAQGRTALLVRALSATGFPRLWRGRWPMVRADLDEAEALAARTGEVFWQVAARAGQAMHEAMRGDSDAAVSLADQVLSSAQLTGVRSVTAVAQHARGVAANASGRYDEAFDLLVRMFDRTDTAHHPDLSGWALPDLADAALRTGRGREIDDILTVATARAARFPSPMLTRSLAYAVAVLTPDDAADDAFREARAADLAEWPVHRARLDLAYGTWLRRRKRILESRAPLRAARDGFDALGAAAWARRAREELRAAGEEDPAAGRGAAELLTAQELQTAMLAAAGLSNREIAQRLQLSPRTVGSHLYRIYPKLQIRGRAQLRAALNGQARDDG
ncbi:DNA-binding CsgD family transcriptional regulator [Actinoplanes octamycinicus]|uniref:DNA-binding CsgD family transcriptional regulator n=1 Tax=Actinoplanes octamycinicus TaxID=135948 RepID=A0A7W7H1M1_9ACTN|nr:LuxR family transcriptional regulator [Actinoplanes octamycinicus]MBB4742299.1 DNA-binding CsgD family transcriptional regulator [Actinoplanes octamycinicus]GIE59856.1 LuxR family transcriptional regulator [Actinoplanes octamycinicus]